MVVEFHNLVIYNRIEEGIFMIEINNASKSYGKSKVKALDNLNLEVKDGEIFGFLGPNGAGKTTTIKLITGILNAEEGSIKINGVDIKNNPVEAKKNIGFVPDNPEIFNRLTGIEYLNFIADVYEVEDKKRFQIINELAEAFEIKDALPSSINSYSHGMKQKLVIIGALLHNPPVWVLDEPMVGLDPKAAFILKDMMRKHADSGKVVFFSTHVMEVAEKVCDRIGIIKKGKLIFVGTIDELRGMRKEDESLENLFLELIEE